MCEIVEEEGGSGQQKKENEREREGEIGREWVSDWLAKGCREAGGDEKERKWFNEVVIFARESVFEV